MELTPELFTPEQAEKFAKELQENDPEWTYRVKHNYNNTGCSAIEVYDEEGCLICCVDKTVTI